MFFVIASLWDLFAKLPNESINRDAESKSSSSLNFLKFSDIKFLSRVFYNLFTAKSLPKFCLKKLKIKPSSRRALTKIEPESNFLISLMLSLSSAGMELKLEHHILLNVSNPYKILLNKIRLKHLHKLRSHCRLLDFLLGLWFENMRFFFNTFFPITSDLR